MSKEIVWIAGGSGLVGQQLFLDIDKSKYDVYILTRSKTTQSPKPHEILWDTQKGIIETNLLPQHIINLAGAGIADQRWTPKRKQELVSSRTQSAETLSKYLDSTNHNIKSYLAASAVGFYGHRGGESLSEESASGDEFMSECCVLWEEASKKLERYSERMCIFRIGIVMSTKDGALPKMLMTQPFRVFNYFGNGEQYYPWIHIRDLVNFIVFSLENSHINGVINTVAPQQITNKEMMNNIMKANKWKGMLLPTPKFILQLVLGEMSAVVLNSNKIDTKKIQNTGYKFLFTDVGLAVKDVIANKI